MRLFWQVSIFMGMAFLGGCVQPSPELMASANSVAPSKRMISGEPRQTCLDHASVRTTAQISEVAIYDQMLTYDVAQLVRVRGGSDIAASLRVYRLPITGENIFGRETRENLVCIYRASGDSLHFISKLWVPSDGRVPIGQRDGTIWRVIKNGGH